jgi:hypothetical protein
MRSQFCGVPCEVFQVEHRYAPLLARSLVVVGLSCDLITSPIPLQANVGGEKKWNVNILRTGCAVI